MRSLLLLLVCMGLGCSLPPGLEARVESLRLGRVSTLTLGAEWGSTNPLATARSWHTATLLPGGTVLITGGEGSSGYLSSAELYDPATTKWSATGSMGTARAGHTATLLSNGRVLVAGSHGPSSPLASAELYDPATRLWSPTSPLATPRYGHTATRLSNGKILVSGGYGSSGYLASAELYDPDTGAWSPTGSLATARYLHTATLLPSGKVLVSGGQGSSGQLSSAELYDPATGQWSPTGALLTARSSHTETLLPSGLVLATGGDGLSGYLSSAELYDPAAETWSATGSLLTARTLHEATLLQSGLVLLTGGEGPSGYLSSAELYDPATGVWSPTSPRAEPRSLHTATLLPSGYVLVTGGHELGGPLSGAELYGTLGTSRAVGPLSTARSDFMASLLPNGQVLVVGGSGASGPLASAEIFDLATEQWTDTAPLGTPRSSATATLLHTGEVLVAGGRGSGSGLQALSTGQVLASAERFNPRTGTWSYTGSLKDARYAHAALLLPNGHVLVMGGSDSQDQPLASVELYNPDTRQWRELRPMRTPRRKPMVVPLLTGQVLVAGGLDAQDNSLASVELFDPETEQWTEAAAMSTPRSDSIAALLPSGEVLVAGGTTGREVLDSSEVYNPLQQQPEWTRVGPLKRARKLHDSLLLPSGSVLVLGGSSGTSSLDDVEVYVPEERAWQLRTKKLSASEDSMTVLLPTGQVLVIGGKDTRSPSPDVPSPKTEVYDEQGNLQTRPPFNINPVRPQRPGALLTVEGRGLRDERGNVAAVRLQTTPVGSLRSLPVGSNPSESSLQVTLPEHLEGYHLLFAVRDRVASGQVVRLDGTPPPAPVVSRPGAFVREPRLVIEGTAEPDSTVKVSVAGLEASSTARGTGAWSLALPTELEEGTYTLTATATDEADNISPEATRTFTLDMTPPPAPEVTPPGEFVNTRRPTLTGTAEAGSTVTLFLNDRQAGTTTASAERLWSLTLSSELEDRSYSAAATARDEAGNVSPLSAARSFTVDTLAPEAPVVLEPREGERGVDRTPVLLGTAEAGSTVVVLLNGVEVGTRDADETGAWSLPLSVALEPGAYAASATATDRAGNVSPASAARSFTVATLTTDMGRLQGGSGLGCTASPGEPSLLLLSLGVLGWLCSRRPGAPSPSGRGRGVRV